MEHSAEVVADAEGSSATTAIRHNTRPRSAPQRQAPMAARWIGCVGSDNNDNDDENNVVLRSLAVKRRGGEIAISSPKSESRRGREKRGRAPGTRSERFAQIESKRLGYEREREEEEEREEERSKATTRAGTRGGDTHQATTSLRRRLNASRTPPAQNRSQPSFCSFLPSFLPFLHSFAAAARARRRRRRSRRARKHHGLAP